MIVGKVLERMQNELPSVNKTIESDQSNTEQDCFYELEASLCLKKLRAISAQLENQKNEHITPVSVNDLVAFLKYCENTRKLFFANMPVGILEKTCQKIANILSTYLHQTRSVALYQAANDSNLIWDLNLFLNRFENNTLLYTAGELRIEVTPERLLAIFCELKTQEKIIPFLRFLKAEKDTTTLSTSSVAFFFDEKDKTKRILFMRLVADAMINKNNAITTLQALKEHPGAQDGYEKALYEALEKAFSGESRPSLALTISGSC